jgi:hypothetical protein
MIINFFIALAFTSLMCFFQFSRWSKINLKIRWWFVISISTCLIQILILGPRSKTRFLLWMNIDFVVSADILNPFSSVHLMTLSTVFLSLLVVCGLCILSNHPHIQSCLFVLPHSFADISHCDKERCHTHYCSLNY